MMTHSRTTSLSTKKDRHLLGSQSHFMIIPKPKLSGRHFLPNLCLQYKTNAQENSIIAVHGLNGHRDNTWTSKGINWLQEFVPQVLPRSRVLVYGYDSRTHGSTPLSRSTLNQIGADFLSELSLMRQDDDTERRPIIFLAHSLGGIVVKSVSTPAQLV